MKQRRGFLLSGSLDGSQRRQFLRAGGLGQAGRWAAYMAVLGRSSAIFLVALRSLLLLLWVSYLTRGLAWLNVVGANNQDLAQEIRKGTAQRVSQVGADGSLTLAKTGELLPAGSYTSIAEVSAFYKNAYYSVSDRVLLTPVDLMSLLYMTAPVWATVAVTVLLLWLDRLRVRAYVDSVGLGEVVSRWRNRVGYRLRRGWTYRTIGVELPECDSVVPMRSIVPWYIAITEWLTVLLMVWTVGSWLWVVL